MAEKGFKVRTTTLTHEERAKIVEGSQSVEEARERVKEALLSKLVAERESENEDTTE